MMLVTAAAGVIVIPRPNYSTNQLPYPAGAAGSGRRIAFFQRPLS